MVQLGIHNQKWNYKTCQCEWKNYCIHAKKIIVGILAHAF